MISEEDFYAVLDATTPRTFLNLFEEHLKRKGLDSYIYLFLPAETSFTADVAEIHHYGYEENPNALQNFSKYLRSSHGARRTKYLTSGLLKPYYSGSKSYKSQLSQADDILFPELDETQENLYMPVHAGASHTGLFIFSGDQEQSKLFKDLRKTQIFCQAAHQRYCEVWTRPEALSVTFSLREREIINWMAQGKSNSVIGELIFMSKHTVDAYLRTIFAKLSVSNRTAAAVKVSQLGLLQF